MPFLVMPTMLGRVMDLLAAMGTRVQCGEAAPTAAK